MRRFLAIIMALAVLFPGMVQGPAPAKAAANIRGELNVLEVKIVKSPQTIYQEFADRYIVGPESWIEWHITVDRNVTYVYSETHLKLENHDDPFLIGDVRTSRDKLALFHRLEGESTLVFRFTPGLYNSSGYLELGRLELAFRGTIEFTGPHPETKQETTLYAGTINMQKIKSLPRVYYKSEYPQVKVHPDPQSLLSGHESNGLSVDRLIVDVHDEILEPKDFQYRYNLVNISGNYRSQTDWMEMEDRNEIPVPPEVRNKSVNLLIEVKDTSGNYRPYTFTYPSRHEPGPPRISMDQSKVLAGREFLYPYINRAKMDPEWRDDVESFAMAREHFKGIEELYQTPQVAYYDTLAIFIFSPYSGSMPGYRGIEDIDLANSGFQWSKNPSQPDLDRPWSPFTEVIPGEEVVSGRVQQGYWVILDPEESYALKEDGLYYLWIQLGDAVSGGAKHQRVYYDPEKLRGQQSASLTPVTFLKDSTPLEIKLSDPDLFERDYDITIRVEDNIALRAAQFKVSHFHYCLWPEMECDEPWEDIPLSSDGRTAERKINTRDYFENLTGAFEGYVYVRAVEMRHKEDGYFFNDPFDDRNTKNIVTKIGKYPVIRDNSVEVKMGYFGERAETCPGDSICLAAAPEQRIWLYGHSAAPEAALEGVYYRVTKSGEPQGWKFKELNTDPLIFTDPGEYVLEAYATERYGGKSNPLVVHFTVEPQLTGAQSVPPMQLMAKMEGGGSTVADDVYGEHEQEELQQLYMLDLPSSSAPTITADYSTSDFTNQDVTVTLKSDMEIQINGTGDYSRTHMFSFDQNGHYTIYYKTTDGQTGQKDIFIGNIDKTGFAENYLMIYTPPQTDPTNGQVTAWKYVGKPVRSENDGLTYQHGWLSYTFDGNGTHVFNATDLAGNILATADRVGASWRTAEVSWINKSIPSHFFTYSTTQPTNQPVTATLHLPGGGAIVNNGGSPDYTFYEDDSFSYVVKDDYGMLHTFTAEVSNIDKTPPVITLKGDLMYPIYQGLPFDFVEPGYSAFDVRDGDLTAKVTVSDDNIDIYKGGYYEIVYTVSDQAGNVAREVRGVPVYAFNGLQVFVNNIRLRGDVQVPRGQLEFAIAGQESDEIELKYLPGKMKLGHFKDQGIPIEGRTLTVTQEGWYTIYARDKEFKTFVGQFFVQ